MRESGIGFEARGVRFAALATIFVLAAFAYWSPPALGASVVCGPGSAAGQCETPMGVAVDREEELVYVADENNARIDVFDAEGHSEGSMGSGQLGSPTHIAVDNSGGPSQGDVYVVDGFRVKKFSPAGALLTSFGEQGSGVCQLSRGGDPIAVGPGGVVYLGDAEGAGTAAAVNTAVKFTEAGACSGEVGLFTGDALRDIAVDSTGAIYTITFSADGIGKYDGAGNHLYTLEEVRFSTALAVDGADNVYAAEREGGAKPVIGEYDSAGNTLRRFGYGEIANNVQGLGPLQSAAGDIFASEVEFAGTQGNVLLLAFPALGPIVLASTLDADPIGNVKATLHAQVNPEGKATEYRFQYVDEASYETEGGFSSPKTKSTAPQTIAMAPGNEFLLHEASAVAGCPNPATEASEGKCLAPETTYRFRVIATNADNPSPGAIAEGSFATEPVVNAEVYASEVGVDTATLDARVNPLGVQASGYFQYVDDATYQASGFEHAIATGPIDFGAGEEATLHTATPYPLQAGTVYHFRLIAEDAVAGEPLVGATHTLRTFLPASPGLDGPCPNEALREAEAAFLPDCRAYEMVSPLDKNNGDIVVSGEFSTVLPAALDQSALGGGRFTYSSFRAFGDAASAPYSVQYLAARTGDGWVNHAIVPPRGSPVLSAEKQGDTEFKAFSPDLCEAWLRTVAEPVLEAKAIAGYPNLYRREDDECGGPAFEALTTLKPGHESPNFFPAEHYGSLELQGLSADGSTALYAVRDNLTTDAPDLGTGGLQLYARSGSQTRFVCILPNGVPSGNACSAGTAAEQNGTMRENQFRNAVSDDGSRVFWSAYTATLGLASLGKIYVRENPLRPQGSECLSTKACTIAVSEAGEVSSGTNFSRFIGAAASGSRAVYLTGGDLYAFQVDTKATTLIAHEVAGVMGMSEDATRIYFVSREDLGGGASAGQPNLYLEDQGTVRFVRTLAGADAPSGNDVSPIGFEPRKNLARVSADGLHAAFMSLGSPTGYDNADAKSGNADAEVYMYDANAGRLVCASCNPGGGRPVGEKGTYPRDKTYRTAAYIPVPENGLYAARVLSDDGTRLYFNSIDALSPRDTNGRQDVYQWEARGAGGCDPSDRGYVSDSEGCLTLISSGKSDHDSEFLDADPTGDNVFFTTLSSLVPVDYGLVDVYDARVDGGLPSPTHNEAECEGEACQSPPAPPGVPTPATATHEGPGNVKASKKSRRCAKGRRAVMRHGKRRCVKRASVKKPHRHGRTSR